MSFTPRRSLGSQGVAPGRASFSPLTPVVRPLSTPLLQLMVRRERLVFLEPGGGPDARTTRCSRASRPGPRSWATCSASGSSPRSTSRLRSELAGLGDDLLEHLARERGAHVAHVPLFRNFPDSTPEDTYELYLRAHPDARVRESRAAVPELHERRPRLRARPVRAPRVHDLLGREGLQRVPDLPPADRPGQPVRAARAGSRAALGPAPAHAPGRRPRPRRHRRPASTRTCWPAPRRSRPRTARTSSRSSAAAASSRSRPTSRCARRWR